MKKLGILGVLVLLVALAFVPQGVVAANPDPDVANLTINAKINPSIEVQINASTGGSWDKIEDASTTWFDNGFTPDASGSGTDSKTAELGYVNVLTNKKDWKLKVYEMADGDNDADGYMYSDIEHMELTNQLYVGKLAAAQTLGVSDDTLAVIEDTPTLTFTDRNGGADMLSGSTTKNTGNYGVTIPVKVFQEVSLDDMAADDYQITLTFEGYYT